MMNKVIPEQCLDWPQKLSLIAVALSWNLHYQPLDDGEDVSLQEDGQNLTFSGALKEFETCKPLVAGWLRKQARLYIEPWLQKLSKDCDLPFESVEFRGQKTRWGSCSETGSISLNYTLLFLPARLVRYVLVHELCHTKQFDHSKLFWELVERHEPNATRLKAELKKANHYVPEWLLK